MSAQRDCHLDHWVELAHDLVTHPRPTFPHLMLRDELSATFDLNCAWNWVNEDFTCGFELVEHPAGWPSPEQQALWQGDVMAGHPVMQWYIVTGTMTAISVGRVPSSIGTQHSRDMIVELLGPVGLDQQLVIPYLAAGSQQRVFTLATTGADFTDEQLTLARQIQPLLLLLGRQDRILDEHAACADAPGDGVGLTGRERAVLSLLAEGLTATAIATRLGCSPGTVRKHLEHGYAKLEVHDRMLAVRRMEELGLLDPSPSPVALS
jgi:DNA-binding CsgD family transcriptional regulator